MDDGPRLIRNDYGLRVCAGMVLIAVGASVLMALVLVVAAMVMA